MVFEERLIVNTYEEAKNIAQYLKSERISSQIISEPVLKNKLALTGRYDAITAFLAGYPDHIRELYAEASEEEKELLNIENPEGDIWKTLQDLLESYHAAAAELLEGENQGDFFCQHLSDFLDQRSVSDPGTDYTRIVRDIEVFRIFYMNQMVEISKSGATLSKMISPDDLIYYIPYEIRIPPDEKVLDTYQVTVVRTFTGKIRYVVTMGPEVVLHEDYQTLFYELSQKGIESDAMFELMDRHINKVRLVGHVINAIMEDDTSLEGLQELFQDVPSVEDGEGRIQDRSDYSSEFVEGMVDELRKMDLVRGKNQRLRPGRLISTKK